SLTLAQWGGETAIRWTNLQTSKNITLQGEVVSSNLSSDTLYEGEESEQEEVKSELRDLGYIS
ncbi:MAG: hypothetical protein ABEI86_13565, partial [Halobacteriaceae archaeon]